MNNMQYGWIVMVPFVAIIGVVLTHWLLARWIKGRHWVIIVVVSFLGEFWVLLETGQSLSGPWLNWFDGVAYLILNTVIFAGLSYGYFTIINLNITALRIRLLKIMYQYPEPLVPEAVLMKEYHPEVVIDMRVNRLQKMGQIHCDHNGNCVLIRKELAYLARLIRQVRVWLNIVPVV